MLDVIISAANNIVNLIDCYTIMNTAYTGSETNTLTEFRNDAVTVKIAAEEEKTLIH